MKKIYMIIIIILSICLTSCDNYSINTLKDYGNIKIKDYKNEVNKEEFVTKIYQYLDTYNIDRHTRDYIYTYGSESKDKKINVCMEYNQERSYKEEKIKFDYENLTYFLYENYKDYPNYKYEKQVQNYNNKIYSIETLENKGNYEPYYNKVTLEDYNSIFETYDLRGTDVIAEVKKKVDYYIEEEKGEYQYSFYIDCDIYTFTRVFNNPSIDNYVKNERYLICQINFSEKNIEFYFKEFYDEDYGRELMNAIPEFTFPAREEKGYYAYCKRITFENVDIPLVDIESLLNNSKQ